MNIGTAFVTDLRGKREGWGHATVETFDWATRAGELTLRLRVRDFDKFGYLLEEIVLQTERGVERSALEAFVRRATYLTEGLRIVEWDDAHGGVVRSEPGEMEAAAKEYFELILRPSGPLTLRRFACGRTRERVGFHLTERLLARLVNDLCKLTAGFPHHDSSWRAA